MFTLSRRVLSWDLTVCGLVSVSLLVCVGNLVVWCFGILVVCINWFWKGLLMFGVAIRQNFC